MSLTWDDGDRPNLPPVRGLAWLRVALRGAAMAAVVFGGLAVMLVLRLLERPLFGPVRPVTPWITVGVCRAVLRIMGLRVTARGARMTGRGAIVANHTGWLDIFVLNAERPLCFVSKSEVADWPGIGWLARATGTLFIDRDRRAAQAQTALLEARLMQGQRMLFFPEGTSTDGQRVLPFRTTLFAAFHNGRLRHEMQVQPMAAVYHAPKGQDPRFYGWWGDMRFGPSLLQVLAQAPQGRVTLVYKPALRVDASPNRKTLAAHLEAAVRAAHREAQTDAP